MNPSPPAIRHPSPHDGEVEPPNSAGSTPPYSIVLCRKPAPPFRRDALAGPLPEQDGLCCLVLAEIAFAGIGHRHREATLHPGPRQHGIEPAFEMRELVRILSEALILLGPTDASHVGDRITPGKILAIGQTFVHDPEQSVHLIGVAVDAVSYPFGCIVAEVISLSCPPICQNSH